ncbi:hypothetical protein H7R52_17565 [Weissella confusa]|uniref:Solute-binding protein family 5 domain-containing protein n=1 Tax=Weissella confusa TaxID=1583 RepID=A0A923NFP3_WEICO|nr:hypothetical protein [Weissella confusa]
MCYNSDELDKLFAKGDAETTEASRQATYKQLQQKIADAAIVYPIVDNKKILVINKDVKGADEAKNLPIYTVVAQLHKVGIKVNAEAADSTALSAAMHTKGQTKYDAFLDGYIMGLDPHQYTPLYASNGQANYWQYHYLNKTYYNTPVSFLPPKDKYATTDVQAYKTNDNKAKQLLHAAGVKNLTLNLGYDSSDAAQKIQANLKGEVDASFVLPTQLKSLKSAHLKVTAYSENRIGYMGLNTHVQKLANVKVRQAIFYALDKHQMNQAAYKTTDFSGSSLTPGNVGTGPYTLESYKQGQEVRFVRNAHYFGGQPKMKHVVLRILTDPNTTNVALKPDDVVFTYQKLADKANGNSDNLYINNQPIQIEKVNDTQVKFVLPEKSTSAVNNIMTDTFIIPKHVYPTNPIATSDRWGLTFDSIQYSPLFHVAEDGSYEPVLATSHEVSSDGKTITVNLRHGVKWSDGQPFTTKPRVLIFIDS